ncbi:hypothetical protein D9758_012093 [Tetrapyrgos nigripes]|uniref:TPR-like protein n=1 Tax=Tetrapyrgos nigripes TaxID=182062 RepID=A0A8H5CBR1_9AGAR|nr:hypothetical protein D9758_012093 [Tetrapyrgos nigripes]
MANVRRSQVASQGSNITLLLLNSLAAASDSFPPLKSVATVAVQVANLVKGFRANQKEWKEFGLYVQDVIACVIQHISNIDLPKNELRQRLEEFVSCLEDILVKIHNLRSQSTFKRALRWTDDPQEIDGMRRKLNESLSLFQLDIGVATHAKLLQSLRVEDIRKVLEAANGKLADSQGLASNLEKLLYMKGASWNKNRACLPGTRTTIIEQVMTWATHKNSSDAAKIFLLTGVAGSGKSSIAHSVAQRCFEEKTLLTSFFFHRETAGLNAPDGFITTLARDLGRINPSIAETISFAIEDDPALPMAHSMSHQFQKFIVEPITLHPVDKPLVIVIDALDEGCNNDFLRILRDDFAHLPSSIRVFLTSRLDDNILRYLSSHSSSHISQQSVDIQTTSNRDDVLVFVRHRLGEIAVQRRLGDAWPSDSQVKELAARSEGLFIWASTVVNYIESTISPDLILQMFLSPSDNPISRLPPWKKMENLYNNILSRCNWDDPGFVKGYALLMGTIVALKTPLSCPAIQALHLAPDAQLIDRVTESTLSSLLLTSPDHSRPIQVLHLSFREYLTSQKYGNSPYFINEMLHSQRLAFLCLKVLDQLLRADLPGTGYLVDVDIGVDEYLSIPTMPSEQISEAGWYACRFWMEHVLDVQLPSEDLQSLLKTFLTLHLVRWLEIVVSLGRYQRWMPVWDWMKNNLPSMSVGIDFEAEFSHSVHCASICLRGMGRLEEALESICEAVELRRMLFARDPARFTADLSSSLNVLSLCLADLGQYAEALKISAEVIALRKELFSQLPQSKSYSLDLARVLMNRSVLQTFHSDQEEAFESGQEAVQLYQELLGSDSSLEFQWDYAKTLNNLSLRLSDLGRRDEALQAVQQSVAIFRQYCDAAPSLSKATLALSLNNLSNCLSSVGQRAEGLNVMKESVNLYRELVKVNPIGFAGDLAMSLSNFSSRLLEVGDKELALDLVIEASNIYGKLVDNHPASFTLQYAKVLNNRSNVLSALGHHAEALNSIQEAVRYYRKYPRLPFTQKPDFVKALNNLSSCLSEAGQQEYALKLLLEAIQLNDPNIPTAADSDPAALLKPDLAMSLNNLSSLLGDMGQTKEALDSSLRAVGLYRELVVAYPTSYRAELATALYNVAEYQSSEGQHQKAIQAIEEAMALYSKLTMEAPGLHQQDLEDASALRSQCLEACSK